MASLKDRIVEYLIPGDKKIDGEPRGVKRERKVPERTKAAQGSFFAGAGTKKHPYGFSDAKVNRLSLILMLVVAADLIAFAFFARKTMFSLSESLCYAFGLDSADFVNHSFRQVEIMLTYALSFFIGGICLWLTMILAVYAAEEAFLKVDRKHILLMCAAFFAITLILTLISRFSGARYDAYSTFRFLAPLMLYTAGTVFLGFSSLRVNIN